MPTALAAPKTQGISRASVHEPVHAEGPPGKDLTAMYTVACSDQRVQDSGLG
jgi:hypothetical protein